MKWILIFLCLPAFGQLPVLPFAPLPSGGTPCVPAFYSVPSGTLIVYLDVTCSSSMTNTANASVATNWFDLSGNTTNSFRTDQALFAANNRGPTYYTSFGPGGKPNLGFAFDAGHQISIEMTNTLGLAQPITMFLLSSFTNVAGGHGLNGDIILDTLTGGREQISPQIPTGNAGTFYAGTVISPPANFVTNQYVVNMFCFDGASSIWRTNNVDYLGGNPGANGLGKVILGTDINGQTQGKFAACLFLIYKGHLTTNDMTTVYNTIKTEFGL